MMAGATSAQTVSIRPRWLNRMKRVSHSAVTGTSMSRMQAITMRSRNSGSERAMAKPAKDAVSSVTGTAMAATSSELQQERGERNDVEDAGIIRPRDGIGNPLDAAGRRQAGRRSENATTQTSGRTNRSAAPIRGR